MPHPYPRTLFELIGSHLHAIADDGEITVDNTTIFDLDGAAHHSGVSVVNMAYLHEMHRMIDGSISSAEIEFYPHLHDSCWFAQQVTLGRMAKLDAWTVTACDKKDPVYFPIATILPNPRLSEESCKRLVDLMAHANGLWLALQDVAPYAAHASDMEATSVFFRAFRALCNAANEQLPWELDTPNFKWARDKNQEAFEAMRTEKAEREVSNGE